MPLSTEQYGTVSVSVSTETSRPPSQTPILELDNITCGYQPGVPTVRTLSFRPGFNRPPMMSVIIL